MGFACFFYRVNNICPYSSVNFSYCFLLNSVYQKYMSGNNIQIEFYNKNIIMIIICTSPNLTTLGCCRSCVGSGVRARVLAWFEFVMIVHFVIKVPKFAYNKFWVPWSEKSRATTEDSGNQDAHEQYSVIIREVDTKFFHFLIFVTHSDIFCTYFHYCSNL